ncbi:MAG: Glycosyl transferase family 39 [Microgenomates group bacterium Gr01-1014_7]|nr:MAG: Glycosyl transferase family 39 [Microgenomates group bacterium Gr01-1014_7]
MQKLNSWMRKQPSGYTMKIKVKIFLFLIILLAAFLRIYKLDQVPPSVNWDEAAAGYNAYAIANWGKDEWGKAFPLVFTSFKDDKHPIHIYLTVPFVKIFGLSDFTTRLPGAIIGVLSVLVIFYLTRILFKNDLTALISALFLAVSPYHLQFSRGLWEVNFALFFFMLGLLMFYLALQKKGWLINISFLSFGLSILSYHSSKIVVPLIVLLLCFFYFKDLRKLSKNFYSGLLIFLVFISLLFIEPRLLGTARVKQTQLNLEDFEKTTIYKMTKNSNLAIGEIFLKNYISHFTPQYLFLTGDQSPRNSVKTSGEFYKIDALFILVGLLYLLKLRSRVTLILLAWLLLSPVPASLVGGAPSATRAVFMMGSMHLLSAFGATKILKLTRNKIKLLALFIILLILSIEVYSYLNYYYNIYPKKEPTDWQYGMKQIVEFVKDHPRYHTIYVTEERSQPYIFFLFYLKEPLPDFRNTVIYNRLDSKSYKYNTVSSFDKYYFGGWDPIESAPLPSVLYVLTPSQYDGLKYRAKFNVVRIIHFPDGGNDFYLVSAQ